MSKPTVWDAAEPEAASEQCPQAGIYENVSFETYCEWDAVNQSRLKLLERSPEHYLLTGHGEVTKALEFGELCHVGVLEADQVSERYRVLPAFEDDEANLTSTGKKPKDPRRTTYYRNAKAEFEREAARDGLRVATEADIKVVRNMVECIQRNTQAVQYLNGKREVSIVWNDPSTGVRCKARIDVVTDDGLTDFKTCPDPAHHEFERSIWKYGYHRQAAWYCDGWEVLTGERLPFRIVACGKEAPRQCCAAEMDSVSVDIGRAENKEALAHLVQCRKSQHWPGYANPECWGLPDHVIDRALQKGTA